MTTTEPLYQLPPVTLAQLDDLKNALEAMSNGEADPDAEVFKLLDLVRKTRAEAIGLQRRNQERMTEVLERRPGRHDAAQD